MLKTQKTKFMTIYYIIIVPLIIACLFGLNHIEDNLIAEKQTAARLHFYTIEATVCDSETFLYQDIKSNPASETRYYLEYTDENNKKQEMSINSLSSSAYTVGETVSLNAVSGYITMIDTAQTSAEDFKSMIMKQADDAILASVRNELSPVLIGFVLVSIFFLMLGLLPVEEIIAAKKAQPQT